MQAEEDAEHDWEYLPPRASAALLSSLKPKVSLVFHLSSLSVTQATVVTTLAMSRLHGVMPNVPGMVTAPLRSLVLSLGLTMQIAKAVSKCVAATTARAVSPPKLRRSLDLACDAL